MNPQDTTPTMNAALYQRVFEEAPESMVLLDPQGTILAMNQRVLETLGYEKEEVVGKRLSEVGFLTGRSKVVALKHFGERVLGKHIPPYTLEFKTKDGEKLRGTVSGRLVYEGDEVVADIVIITQLVHHDQLFAEVEYERDLMQQYLDVAGVILVMIGVDKKIQLINRQGEEMLEAKRGDILGKNWFETFLPDSGRGEVVALFEDMVTGRRPLVEHHQNEILSTKGTVRTIKWHNAFVRKDGEIVGVLSSGEDVTEQLAMAATQQQSVQVLQATAVAAEQFFRLGAQDWKQAVQSFIAVFGSTVSVDRVGLYKRIDDTQILQLAYEWVSEKTPTKLGHQQEVRVDLEADGCGRWLSYFQKGKSIHEQVEELPGDEAEIPFLTDIKTILALPVYVGDEWWGMMTLEDVVVKRTWSQAEVDALKTAAITFGSAIQRKRAEETLRKFVVGMDRSNDIVFMTDRSGAITYVNQAFCETYGYEAGEAVGQTPRILKSGTHDQSFYSDFWETLLAGRVVAAELTNKKKTGELVTIEASANPIMNDAGEVTGFLAIQRDVTERKRIEAALKLSEERYRDLFDNAHDLIQSVRADGTFIFVNQAWKDALGYDNEEVQTLRFWEVVAESHHEVCRSIFRDLAAGKEVGMVEVQFLTKDGRELTVEGSVSGSYGDSGELEATRGIFRDVTERNAAMSTLRHRTEELERMNKVMVGRELRMIELKQQIAHMTQVETGKTLDDESRHEHNELKAIEEKTRLEAASFSQRLEGKDDEA